MIILQQIDQLRRAAQHARADLARIRDVHKGGAPIVIGRSRASYNMYVLYSPSASTLTSLTLRFPPTCRPRVEREHGRDGCENEPGVRRAYARVSFHPLASGTDRSHQLTAYSIGGRALTAEQHRRRAANSTSCEGPTRAADQLPRGVSTSMGRGTGDVSVRARARVRMKESSTYSPSGSVAALMAVSQEARKNVPGRAQSLTGSVGSTETVGRAARDSSTAGVRAQARPIRSYARAIRSSIRRRGIW